MATETFNVRPGIRAGIPPSKARQYGPLVATMLAIVYIALVVLPSTLNLPPQTIHETLAYAPVPPDDNSNSNDTNSGLNTLNAASSGTLGTSGPTGDGPGTGDKPKLDAKARLKLSKKCVGKQQTEDPNSPYCQPFFEGDNGGATYQGVTKDEIRVVVYQNTVITNDSNRTESSPAAGNYCDIDTLECNGVVQKDPHVWLRVARAFSQYFNDRYQTYGRHVHVYFYWSNGTSEAARRSDAADNWARIQPFAVVDQAWYGGFHEAYVDSIAHRKSMIFASYVGQPRTFFQKYAPQVWSFWPDVENWADQYAGYLCAKVAGTNVVGSIPGSSPSEFQGQKRKYGLYYTSDPGFPSLQLFKDQVVKLVSSCGITFDKEDILFFPYSGWAVDAQGDRSYAETNIAKWKTDNVNTIIWAGGSETDTSKAASAAAYHPDWIVAGDGVIDSNAYSQVQGQDSWQNAWTQSYQLATGDIKSDPSYTAYHYAEPNGQDDQWAQLYYRDWFMLFQSIQVSGPTLNPQKVDAGLHAIQRHTSDRPDVAAGYYLPGDYTYVKDGNEMWWNPKGNDPSGGGQGCWMLVNKGSRYPAESWASTNPKDPQHDPQSGGISKQRTNGLPDGKERNVGRDICTGYTNAQGIRT